jgi:hypothetical protein
MNTNRQTFRNHISTSTARLGAISRVHGDDLNTSFFRFVFEHLSEQAKPSIMRGQRQVSVSVHKAERKIFNCYPVMLDNQPATDLVEIIQPLVGNMLMQPGDLQVCFLLPVTAFRLAASMALQAAQLSQLLSQPAGILNQLPRGESRKAFQANIHANLFAGSDALRHRVRQFQHEADIPTGIGLLDHGVLDFGLRGYRPVVTQSHFAHVLNVEAHPPMLVLAQFAAIPIGILDALEAIAILESWEPRLILCFDPAK